MRQPGTPKQQSAGLLLYRQRGAPEVLLGHPGGPFWAKKDDAAWTIPKGLISIGETPLAAARREFAEETGYRPRGKALALGEARQPGGKLVHVWAVEGDWDISKLRSNSFEMEWPPKSGRRQEFPELDRAAWFTLGEARRKNPERPGRVPGPARSRAWQAGAHIEHQVRQPIGTISGSILSAEI
jgi:predicted NUDIX family NTP pyrophosphohydrolase